MNSFEKLKFNILSNELNMIELDYILKKEKKKLELSKIINSVILRISLAKNLYIKETIIEDKEIVITVSGEDFFRFWQELILHFPGTSVDKYHNSDEYRVVRVSFNKIK